MDRLTGVAPRHGGRPAIAFVAALAAAAPAGALTWSVPGLANVSGKNKTHFASDLRVVNQGPAPALVRLELVPVGGGAAPAPVTRTVLPAETLVLDNALLTLWNLKEKSGTVRVSADAPLLITARTYNDADPRGSFGQALEPVADDQLLQTDEIGHAPWVEDWADLTKGFRTNAGVFLAAPGSAADLVILDAAGLELGRKSLSGGPLAYQAAVSTIVPGGVALGRAELRVRSGSATGYLSVVDNITGDAISVPFRRPPGDAVDLALNGVAHTSGRGGTTWRTDVRLLNLSPYPRLVTVTPLSATKPLSGSASVVLAGGELKAVADVLVTLLAAPDGTSGALRFAATGPIMLLARTANVPQGGGGTFGAAHRGVSYEEFVQTGSSAMLIGLRQSSSVPGARTNVGFLAGPSGLVADATLHDAAGHLVASRTSAVTLGADGWVQPTLAALFPGITIPADAALTVTPASGEGDVYASTIDNATGDPVTTGAAPVEPYVCPAPTVYTFVADAATLPAAGQATLSWYTDADAVTITPPGGSARAAIGSLATPVGATTTFTLQATNGCGATSTSLTVAVGPPAVSAVSPESAAPGTLVRLRVGNLVRPGDVSAIELRFALGPPFTVDPEGVDGDGRISFVVPLIADAGRPRGYWEGACTVRVVAGDASSAGVPFTVAPLAYAGDPVAGFAAYLDGLFGMLHAHASALGSLDGASAAAAAVDDAVSRSEAVLRAVASDLAVATSTTCPVDVPTDADPAPPTAVVTRQAVADYLALVANLKSALPQLPAATATRSSGPGSCAVDKIPALNMCVAVGDVTEIGRRIDAGLGGVLGYIGPLLELGKMTGLAAIASIAEVALNAGNVICLVYPVYLTKLQLDPKTLAYPVRTDRVRNRAALKASMIAITTRENVGNYLKGLVATGLSRLLRSPTAKPTLEALLKALDDALPVWKATTNTIIGAAALALGTPEKSKTIQIGMCDLIALPTATRAYLEYHDPDQGTDDFYFRNTRKARGGSTEVFSTQPRIDHFLFTPETRRSFGMFKQENVEFRPTITLGRGRRLVLVGTTAQQVAGAASTFAAGAPNGVDVDVSDGAPFEGAADSGGGSHFDLAVIKLSPNRWRLTFHVRGGPASFTTAQVWGSLRFFQTIPEDAPEAQVTFDGKSSGSMAQSATDDATASLTFASAFGMSTGLGRSDASWALGSDAHGLPASFDLVRHATLAGASSGTCSFRLVGLMSLGGPSDEPQPTGTFSISTTLDFTLRDH